MAADNYSLCLIIGAMDRLWFQQIILFTESTNSLVPKTLNQHRLVADSFADLSSSAGISLTTLAKLEQVSTLVLEDEIPSAESPPRSPLKDIDPNNEEEEEDKDVEVQQERPTRLNHIIRRGRSHSSSRSSNSHKHPITMKRRSSSLRVLEKTMSFRTLGELELEEVKGFMDLGFIFKKEYLSPRMMSVLPGLQRLGGLSLNKTKQDVPVADDLIDSTGVVLLNGDDDKVREEEEEEEDIRGIVRPYLSEAWVIKRPHSPLLSLRVPRATAAADMKKHLRSWARTVASVVYQES